MPVGEVDFDLLLYICLSYPGHHMAIVDCKHNP